MNEPLLYAAELVDLWLSGQIDADLYAAELVDLWLSGQIDADAVRDYYEPIGDEV